jgi:hypothetical protein
MNICFQRLIKLSSQYKWPLSTCLQKCQPGARSSAHLIFHINDGRCCALMRLRFALAHCQLFSLYFRPPDMPKTRSRQFSVELAKSSCIPGFPCSPSRPRRPRTPATPRPCEIGTALNPGARRGLEGASGSLHSTPEYRRHCFKNLS